MYGVGKLRAYKNPHLGVEKGKFGALEEALLLAVYPIVFTDILFKSPDRKLALLLSEPLGRTWEVREDEVGGRCYTDCDGTLNDEEPAPSSEAVKTIHVSCDRCSNQTTECARDQGTGVQNGGSETKFFAGIPTGQVVKTARLWNVSFSYKIMVKGLTK